MSSSQSQMSAGHEGPSSAALLPSEVLERAAALIEPEGAWTQGAFARSEDGTDVEDLLPGEAEPTCFCLYGAIHVANGKPANEDGGISSPYVPYLRRALGLDPHDFAFRIADWNDAPERTQPEVVAALRAAAELAKAEGQ